MRLALINQFYPPDVSPTAHLCASLAEHRAAMGDQVTVVTSRSAYLAMVGRESTSGEVDVRRIWSTRWGSRSRLRRFFDWATFYASALIATVRLPRQDVIISLTTPPYVALAALLHKRLHSRTKIILWNMDCYPEAIERTGMVRAGGLVSRAMRAMNRMIFRRIDHLICLDGAMQLLLSQYKPSAGSLPTTIIPNWERASMFADEAAKPMQWDAAAAAALRDRFVVLYLGNAGYGHEFSTMIEAATLLRNEPVVFLFVGGGAMLKWIDQQCRDRSLSNVLLHDYVPKEQTPSVMRDAGCALITLEEQVAGVMSPSKLHANLAMGLPILYIGPPNSNVDEAIQRFGCGASLRAGQAREMANFIRMLKDNPSAHQQLRRKSRAAFEQAYSDAQTLPQFDRVLEQVIAH
jgi:colanic acid biosynthesis glycosyl transferase WcaI